MNEESLLVLLRHSLPITHPSILVESGDDCAIVQAPKTGVVLKTDAVVEGVHFFSGTKLEAVGWKAICRPISDFAAMGAIPQHALITVAAPSSWTKKEWLALARGINKAARKFEITIVGGEITRSPSLGPVFKVAKTSEEQGAPAHKSGVYRNILEDASTGTTQLFAASVDFQNRSPLFLSVTLTGSEGSRSLLRSGGKPDDLLCVTGKLGGSLKSGRHLTFTPRLAEGQWLAKQKGVHAMMDLSDGLGSDLPRLAKASQCSFFIDQKNLPRHPSCSLQAAISDGEDYELLFCIDPKEWKQLSLAWERKFPRLSLTCIGHLIPHNEPATPLASGFEHFGSEHYSDTINSATTEIFNGL